MLASHSQAAPGAPPELASAAAVPPHAVPHVAMLRVSLRRYRERPTPAALDEAFACARALVCPTAPGGAAARPDLAQMRRLAAAVPAFDDFLSAAAGEAERALNGMLADLWLRLRIPAAAPTWNAAEREAARMAFACACAPSQAADPARLRAGLRSLAAARFAEQLADELAGSEPAWQAALGERYESVRHRCAPRTPWRSRGLSELLRIDDAARSGVVARLTRWL